jgi:hypothetical protein
MDECTTDRFVARLAAHVSAEERDRAVGGMLREAGKHDGPRLLAFLDAHAAAMPRTMLRYAVEHLDQDQRAPLPGASGR